MLSVLVPRSVAGRLGLAVAATIALAGGVLALVAGLPDDEDGVLPATTTGTPDATAATPTPVPSPQASVTPEVGPDGVQVQEFAPGAPVHLVSTHVLYWSWAGIEGPYQNLQRAYRAADGEIVIEDLYRNLPGAPAELVASVQDFSTGRLAAVVCRKSYCGGYGPPQPDAEPVLLLSNDGGVTWSEEGVLPIGWFPVDFLDDELLAVQYDDVQTFQEYHFLLYPSGTPFEVPRGSWPSRLPDGRVVFVGVDGGRRVEDGAGNVLYEPPALPSGVSGSTPILAAPSLSWTQWWVQGATYLGERDAGQFTRVYRLTGGALYLHRVLAGGGVVGRRDSADLTALTPVVIDLETGTIHPIAGLGPERRYFVALGARPGTFVAARPGPGDCLNVRAAPSLTGDVLACVAEGVLLELAGDRHEADGIEWSRVRTPTGAEGWAAREFLR